MSMTESASLLSELTILSNFTLVSWIPALGSRIKDAPLVQWTGGQVFWSVESQHVHQ